MQNQTGDAKWVTTATVAEYLGVSARTVLRMAARGEIESATLPNGHHRYNWESVQAALKVAA